MSKIIFFNIGWMDFYQGIGRDTITGGGKHVDTVGWGGEMYNFREFKGRNYGYVQIGGDLNLLRLDVDYPDDIVKNVIVVWTAKEPDNGGTYIIGWYKTQHFTERTKNHRQVRKENGRSTNSDTSLLPKLTTANFLRKMKELCGYLAEKMEWDREMSGTQRIVLTTLR